MEGRTFDGIKLTGTSTSLEFFHPIKVTARGSMVTLQDPFGNAAKLPIGRIKDYTSIPLFLKAIADCRDNSQNILTEQLIAEIRAMAFFPDFIVSEDGAVKAPNLTTTIIDSVGNTSLITKEYADANYAGGGGTMFSIAPALTGDTIAGKAVWVRGIQFTNADRVSNRVYLDFYANDGTTTVDWGGNLMSLTNLGDLSVQQLIGNLRINTVTFEYYINWSLTLSGTSHCYQYYTID